MQRLLGFSPQSHFLLRVARRLLERRDPLGQRLLDVRDDALLERVFRKETLSEREITGVCDHVKEILKRESNMQLVTAPVVVVVERDEEEGH